MECPSSSNNNSTSLLYDLAECPVCYEVRRDTPVFICANGHNVCAVCKAKVAQCPQGACQYSDPPTRNRTVERLIANGQFKFACKFRQGTLQWRQLKLYISAITLVESSDKEDAAKLLFTIGNPGLWLL
jgi:hypothetical protein